MHKTLAEIAQIVNGTVVGDSGLVITGLSGIKEAKNGDLTFVAHPKYFPFIKETNASALLVSPETKVTGKSIIVVDQPSEAFSKIAAVILTVENPRMKGIHPTAVIAKDASIGKNVSIGPHVVIENKAKINDNVIIDSGSYIGASTLVGEDTLIYPNVTVTERITIGKRVVIHSGAVIGSDGFGFADIQGGYEKVPQLGTVVIEDDVEIGANVTIDRARFDKTLIGRGTKIDNLVHIAHNVKIGEDCIILALVGISGSVTIGNKVILAGQAGVAGHLTIGDGAIVAAKTGVSKSVPAHVTVSGFPVRPIDIWRRNNAYFQRLPKYVQMLKELKARIEELEGQLSKDKKKK